MNRLPLLLEIIEWVLILETDIMKLVEVPDKNNDRQKGFTEFHRELVFMMLQKENSSICRTKAEFIQLLRRPIGVWNFFDMELFTKEGVSKDLLILDDLGVTDEAIDLLNDEVSSLEASSKLIREVLDYCRQKYIHNPDLARQYVVFRLFIINNPVVSREILKRFIREERLNDHLSDSLNYHVYEPIPPTIIHKCKNCGWTLEDNRCLRKECLKKMDKYNPVLLDKKEIKRVKRGIQLSTVIPGKQEVRLGAALEKIGWTVSYYPDIERKGDIHAWTSVRGERKEMYIDVKDYVNPMKLVAQLEDDYHKGLIKCDTIAVPETKANKHYIMRVVNELKKRNLLGFRVCSFRQLLSECKQDLKLSDNLEVTEEREYELI